MRNILEYPITTTEIVDLLERCLAEHDAEVQNTDGPVGSMTGMVLEEAIRRIRTITDWGVYRQDDYGTVIPVREGLSEKDASILRALLEARGHKQLYTVSQSSLSLTKMTERFVSACCQGERCYCGAPAEHKVEEVIFDDDPTGWVNTNAWIEVPPVGRVLARHPLTRYVCHEHFAQIMGPAASERDSDRKKFLDTNKDMP
jgi:hypothetical protein